MVPIPTVIRANELILPKPRQADAVRVLLVTGGHDHDIAFYSVLDGQLDLEAWVDPHPNAFVTASPDGTAVVGLYDMEPPRLRGERR